MHIVFVFLSIHFSLCFLLVSLSVLLYVFVVVLFYFLRKSIPWNAGVKQVWIHRYVKQQDMPSFIHMLSSIALVQALQIPFGIVSSMFYKFQVLTAPFRRLLPWWVERNRCFSAAQGKSLPFAQKRGCKEQRLPMWLACVWLKACSNGDSIWLHPNSSCLVFWRDQNSCTKLPSKTMSKKNGFTEAVSAAASSSWVTPASTFI